MVFKEYEIRSFTNDSKRMYNIRLLLSKIDQSTNKENYSRIEAKNCYDSSDHPIKAFMEFFDYAKDKDVDANINISTSGSINGITLFENENMFHSVKLVCEEIAYDPHYLSF